MSARIKAALAERGRGSPSPGNGSRAKVEAPRSARSFAGELHAGLSLQLPSSAPKRITAITRRRFPPTPAWGLAGRAGRLGSAAQGASPCSADRPPRSPPAHRLQVPQRRTARPVPRPDTPGPRPGRDCQLSCSYLHHGAGFVSRAPCPPILIDDQKSKASNFVASVHTKVTPVILPTTSAKVALWRRSRRKHSRCRGRCRMMRFGSWRAARGLKVYMNPSIPSETQGVRGHLHMANGAFGADAS